MIFKSVITLIAGSAMAQLISFAVTPVLTRLYGPDEFGTLSVFTAVVGLLAVFVTGKYSEAIILENNECDAANLFSLSVFIAISFSIVMGLAAYICIDKIKGLHELSKIKDWIGILILMTFLNGVYQAGSSWMNRSESYRLITNCKLIQALAVSLVAACMAIADFYGGLIWGELLGVLCVILYILYKLESDLKNIHKHISFARMKLLAVRHMVFPTVNLAHSLTDVLQLSGVVFLISINYGDSALGCYALAMKIMRAPISMIASSAAQVLYIRLINEFNTGYSMRPVLNKFIITTGIVLLPIYLIIMFFGALLFQSFFGNEWMQAGEYAQILSPWMGLSVISSIMSCLPLIVREQKTFFIFSLVGNFVPLTAFLLVPYTNAEIYETLKFVAIAMTAHASLTIAWLYSLSTRLNTAAPQVDKI
jgi:O-antigen/teichoic acid export membrane protein